MATTPTYRLIEQLAVTVTLFNITAFVVLIYQAGSFILHSFI